MPIFSFIPYTLTELFRKPNNLRQIYKQASLTFYTSNMCLKRVEKKKLLGRHNKDILLRFIFELDKWDKRDLEKSLQSEPPKRKHQNKARKKVIEDHIWIYPFQY